MENNELSTTHLVLIEIASILLLVSFVLPNLFSASDTGLVLIGIMITVGSLLYLFNVLPVKSGLSKMLKQLID